jgi:hypothetical protein
MRLTVDARKALSGSDFAGPGRSFPVEDKDHAEAALMDVNKAKGLSAAEKATIKRKAKAKLDEKNDRDLHEYLGKTYGRKK